MQEMQSDDLAERFNRIQVSECDIYIHNVDSDAFRTSDMQIWETEGNAGHFICITYDVHADTGMTSRTIFPTPGMYNVRCVIGFHDMAELETFTELVMQIKNLYRARGGNYKRMTYANITGEIFDKLIWCGTFGQSFLSVSAKRTDL